MKQHLQLGGWLLGSSTLVAMTLMAQPAQAQTVIREVAVESTANGLELILTTRDGDRPQIFTINRDNTLTADIISTRLDLENGNGFRQENPAPGIAAIEVRQLDANSVRVIATGISAPPAGEVSVDDDDLIFTFASSGATTAQAPAPSAPAPTTPAPASEVAPSLPPQNPNVLVPNPEITIDGVPIPRPQPQIVPPFLPRAVAPPLGDIAVSTVDTTPDLIDLGTDVRVPRLVLRDAPAREVLSLLARAADLNLAYTNVSAGDEINISSDEGGEGPLVTLDLENEPVQNAFNTVLRITGLQASMIGRTIFVGPRLPDNARNVVSRTFRLNQASAAEISSFLTTLGAETQQAATRRTVTEVGEGINSQFVVDEQPVIRVLRPEGGEGALPLRGLTSSADPRLNTITLVGTPRQIEIATSYIQQLDLRQRQVAVNVKIVDVNLLNTQDFNTSFSFGIGDSYFSVDRGSATVNYGDLTPPTAETIRNSLTGRPSVANPYEDSEIFLDNQDTFSVAGTAPGITLVDERTGRVTELTPRGAANFLAGEAAVSNNPFLAGITEVDLAEDTIITVSADGTIAVDQGEVGEVTLGVPSYVQYSRDFLASLQAQIVSGNAKILTDPTLVIQEGQQASVGLTEQVVTNFTVAIEEDDFGRITETQSVDLDDAGLTLDVSVSRIDDNGFVTLQINPRVSAPAQVQDVGDGEITLLAERTLSSGEIRLRDGQTLILSGIIQESDRTLVSKVPILGDLPIIGSLFRSTSRENSRREVIVLVTPSILDDSDQAIFGYGYTPGRQVQEVLQRER